MYEPFLRVQLAHSCIGAEKGEEEGAELMSPDEERESHEVVPLITPVNPQLLMEEIVNTCNLPTDESKYTVTFLWLQELFFCEICALVAVNVFLKIIFLL